MKALKEEGAKSNYALPVVESEEGDVADVTTGRLSVGGGVTGGGEAASDVV